MVGLTKVGDQANTFGSHSLAILEREVTLYDIVAAGPRSPQGLSSLGSKKSSRRLFTPTAVSCSARNTNRVRSFERSCARDVPRLCAVREMRGRMPRSMWTRCGHTDPLPVEGNRSLFLHTVAVASFLCLFRLVDRAGWVLAPVVFLSLTPHSEP